MAMEEIRAKGRFGVYVALISVLGTLGCVYLKDYLDKKQQSTELLPGPPKEKENPSEKGKKEEEEPAPKRVPLEFKEVEIWFNDKTFKRGELLVYGGSANQEKRINYEEIGSGDNSIKIKLPAHKAYRFEIVNPDQSKCRGKITIETSNPIQRCNCS